MIIETSTKYEGAGKSPLYIDVHPSDRVPSYNKNFKCDLGPTRRTNIADKYCGLSELSFLVEPYRIKMGDC